MLWTFSTSENIKVFPGTHKIMQIDATTLDRHWESLRRQWQWPKFLKIEIIKLIRLEIISIKKKEPNFF